MRSVPSVAPVEGTETAPAQDSCRTGTSESLNESARGALGGEPFAVQKFLQAIAPLVRKICRGILGRDTQELEDTIQDCLIDVVRALPRFRFEADVSHYVAKITMRRAIASRRHARARSKQYLEIDPRILRLATSEDAQEARAALVRSLLDDLNEAQATVLLLRLMLGHSIAEIACFMGVPENTVKTRLRLGKNQLRRWLERRGEGSRARY
jgi:RNA polymerase sigma-70 factor, ECF subfamily